MLRTVLHDRCFVHVFLCSPWDLGFSVHNVRALLRPSCSSVDGPGDGVTARLSCLWTCGTDLSCYVHRTFVVL